MTPKNIFDSYENHQNDQPTPNLVDLCSRLGKENCDDKTCILFRRGCPIARRTEPCTAKPTQEGHPK